MMRIVGAVSADADPYRVRELGDRALIDRYCRNEAEADDPEQTALAQEIRRRDLDL